MPYVSKILQNVWLTLTLCTQLLEFNTWKKVITLHITLIHSGKVQSQLFSLFKMMFVSMGFMAYEVHTISFQTFFVWAFKIVVDPWKFSILLIYIVWDDWQILMISGSNEQLQQQLQYALLKPDCHSWWISKMQSGREDTLEERYAIKFCFKPGKNASDTYGMLQTAFRPYCMHRDS